MMEEKLVSKVKDWIAVATALIKERLEEPLDVERKSNYSDLVTNVDKEVESFFVQQIRKEFPTDKILGEEGMGGEPVTDFSGRVWVIDPIDGTLNFVKQQENFCIMIGIYEDGKPVLGFIYEVMKKELIWGGPQVGVFINDTEINQISTDSLKDSLVNVNTMMFLQNDCHTQEIGLTGLGVRMCGCAGIGFKDTLLGRHHVYISYLQPWDYGAGLVLAETLGFVTIGLDNNKLDLKKRVPVLVTTPIIYQELQETYEEL